MHSCKELATGITNRLDTSKDPIIEDATATTHATRIVLIKFIAFTGTPEILASLSLYDVYIIVLKKIKLNNIVIIDTPIIIHIESHWTVINDPNKYDSILFPLAHFEVRIPATPTAVDITIDNVNSEYFLKWFLTISIMIPATILTPIAQTVGIVPAANPRAIPHKEVWDRVSPIIDSLFVVIFNPMIGSIIPRRIIAIKALCMNE